MAMANATILDVQNKYNGVTEGFDYLRVILACVILLIHSISLSTHYEMTRPLWFGGSRFVLAFSLPMFFCLSGFLVSGSLLRNSLFSFVMLRAIRIVPALAFETVLCAVLLGGMFTDLPLGEYFRSRGFLAYFGNIVGLIHFTLPGVFSERPLNVQLWTIPFELECYLALVLLSVFGFIRKRLAVLLVFLFFIAALSVFYLTNPYPANEPQGRVLVCAFLAGVVFYIFRDRITLSKNMFILSLLTCILLLNEPPLNPLAVIPLTYVTIFIGLMRLPKIKFGDLSYGIYLFHYPLIRVYCEIFDYDARWYVVFPVCLVASTIFSIVSWRLVEKPVLDRKKIIISSCEKFLRLIFQVKLPVR